MHFNVYPSRTDMSTSNFRWFWKMRLSSDIKAQWCQTCTGCHAKRCYDNFMSQPTRLKVHSSLFNLKCAHHTNDNMSLHEHCDVRYECFSVRSAHMFNCYANDAGFYVVECVCFHQIKCLNKGLCSATASFHWWIRVNHRSSRGIRTLPQSLPLFVNTTLSVSYGYNLRDWKQLAWTRKYT